MKNPIVYTSRVNLLNLLLLLFVVTTTKAQSIQCGQEFALSQLDSIGLPVYDFIENNEIEILLDGVQEFSFSSRKTSEILPVVFHVIHSGFTEGQGDNVADATILSTLSLMNDHFGGLNNAPDTGIQFCPAERTPNNQTTDGIDRIDGTSYYIQGQQYSGIDNIYGSYILQIMNDNVWNPKDYINIWIMDNIVDALGYSSLGQGHSILI